MRKRRMIALILAGALLAGQTAYAQEIVPGKESVDVQEKSTDMTDLQELLAEKKETPIVEERVDAEQNQISVEDDEKQSNASETIDSTEEEFVAESVQNKLPDDEVVIKDQNLKDVLMKQSYYDVDKGYTVYYGDDGYISVSEMERLENLSISNVKIGDLSGLEYAVNIQNIDLSNADISELSDISPLKNLTSLNNLNISGSNITDISDLGNLTGLYFLYLSDTDVRDISVLKNLYQLDWVILDNTPVSDLSPLADLPSLYTIGLNGCSEVTTLGSLDTLLENHQIHNLDIRGTSVSEMERLDILCKMYIPSGLSVGDDDIYLNSVVEDLFNPGFQFSIGLTDSSSDCISISNNVISVKSVGSAILRLSLNNTVKDYVVEVLGVPDEDIILGESIDYTVDYISEKDGWNTSTILTSNGELWELYPEASCIKKNVKSYVSEWVYSGSDAVHVKYALDKNNVLWSGETRIAENIQKYDGHYALTTDHVLIDIYNDQDICMEGVNDWVQEVSKEYNYTTGEFDRTCKTYVLKQDGTLWAREEVEKTASVNQFQKVTDGVKQLFDDYYLADDGKYYYFSGTETSYSQNFDDQGNFCPGGKVVGKFNIKEYFDNYYSIHFLTEEGDFYHWYFTGGAGGGSGIWTGGLVLSDVTEITRDTDRHYICKRSDGTYYSVSGSEAEEISQYRIDWLYDGVSYDLLFDTDTGEKWLERNGVVLLDHILTAWESDFFLENDDIESIVYAVRTDGTVWKMENRIPVKIADLNDTGIEKGNLNGDGSINVVDLMMCLHYVSGRESLEGNALLAADINGDGIVNVVDLMRMLHFVSGRSTTL